MDTAKNLPQINTLFLLAAIAACRQKLQALWDMKGVTDEEVLTASVELDELMNLYQRCLLK